MATFDQRGQIVQYQYAADVININGVSNRAEFARAVDNISAEIARASSLNVIDQIQAERVEDTLKQASIEAQRPEPNKGRVAALLETAGNAVRDVTALGGLYLGIEKAIELAHKLL